MATKKVFLVVSSDSDRQQRLKQSIQKIVPGSTIYLAKDGADGLAKIKNAPPDVVITDYALTKVSGSKFVDGVLGERSMGGGSGIAVIIAEPLPESEMYLDEIVMGQVQFLEEKTSEEDFGKKIFKALDFASIGKEAEFHLRYLSKGEILLHEGAGADFVYIVKTGQLRAFKGQGDRMVVLGTIETGEFVGEMAYINGEPRSATVEALANCELIEIPVGTLEDVLYKRPAWSRALLRTLSKRLKQANVIAFAPISDD